MLDYIKRGAFDELYTPAYAIKPLLNYIPNNVKTVWCPCDALESNIVQELLSFGYDIIYSHKDEGKDFFKCEPEGYDMIITNPPYSCYSDDTEVFTKRGWINIKNIVENDVVLSLDYNSNEISWDKIKYIIKKEVNENLLNFKNKNMDLLVTKDHRMLAYNRYNNQLTLKNGDLITAEDVYNSKKYYMPKEGFCWSGVNKKHFVLPALKNPPRSKIKEYPELEIDLHSWLEFFGLWLADGYTTKFKGLSRGYTVGIKQAEDGWPFVENLLNKLPFDYKVQYDKEEAGLKRKCNFCIYNRQLWIYLEQFGKARDKFIPRWIKDLPCDYLQSFMKGYTFGDSYKTRYKNNVYINYSSVSKQLIEDIQEILLKLGNLTQITEKKIKNGIIYSIVLNKNSVSNRAMYIRTKKADEVPYEGNVYCLTLKKNSVFLVRRNNKTMFCGNCKDDIIKRCYELKKPFALLLPMTALEGTKRHKLFKNGIGLIALDKRCDFNSKGSCWFNTSWFVHSQLTDGRLFFEILEK